MYFHRHVRSQRRAHLQTKPQSETPAPAEPAEKPGNGMEARHAGRPEGTALGGRCATAGSGSGKRNGLNDKALWGTAIRRAADGGRAGRRARSPRQEKIGSDSHVLIPAGVLMERAGQCSVAQDRCVRNKKRRLALRLIQTHAPIRQAGLILQTEAPFVTQGIH
ncbi:hypothetical protein PQQ59_22420 [Paraburkholderia aspalathi]|uniref:hypothetical protein n=1 Tax=Paraburkholderia aspalathi TaxID=1324617 RepID=UPI0038B82756